MHLCGEICDVTGLCRARLTSATLCLSGIIVDFHQNNLLFVVSQCIERMLSCIRGIVNVPSSIYVVLVCTRYHQNSS
jgi:hypothetical protein